MLADYSRTSFNRRRRASRAGCRGGHAGLDFAIARNATLGVAYSGQFGDRATDQSVKGNLAMKF